jgi:circadian clock protein KaiB
MKRQSPSKPRNGLYRLKLFVTGTTPVSGKAVRNIREFCETYLPNDFQLEVIDIAKEPGLAKENQLIAVPTLIKEQPLPVRRFIGDMSATDKLISGLNLKPVV